MKVISCIVVVLADVSVVDVDGWSGGRKKRSGKQKENRNVKKVKSRMHIYKERPSGAHGTS